jgi:prevent-host-death family protein
MRVFSSLWLDFVSEKRHTKTMEAGIKELRDHLSRYLDVVRDGNEVTVTDHGTAVARLVPVDRPRPLDRLIAEGLVTPAQHRKRARPVGRGITAKGTVSDLVTDQRQ